MPRFAPFEKEFFELRTFSNPPAFLFHRCSTLSRISSPPEEICLSFLDYYFRYALFSVFSVEHSP